MKIKVHKKVWLKYIVDRAIVDVLQECNRYSNIPKKEFQYHAKRIFKIRNKAYRSIDKVII